MKPRTVRTLVRDPGRKPPSRRSLLGLLAYRTSPPKSFIILPSLITPGVWVMMHSGDRIKGEDMPTDLIEKVDGLLDQFTGYIESELGSGV
jgi:hypothetical protein